MKLTILGCSGSIPSPESPASGYLVESGDTSLVVDLGNGTLGALPRFRDPFAVDGLLLSHLHPDHCADFGALTVLRRFSPLAPHDPTERRLPVFGPEGTPDRLVALEAPNEADRASADLSDVYVFAAVTREPLRIGAFHIQPVPMNHVCPTWGFRIAAEGRVLAYTGDTGPCDELTELARDADLLLSEASWTDFADAPPDVHLSGRQAGRAAKTAGVQRLLLTHVQPWADRDAILHEAGAEFDGPLELAEAGRTYRV